MSFLQSIIKGVNAAVKKIKKWNGTLKNNWISKLCFSKKGNESFNLLCYLESQLGKFLRVCKFVGGQEQSSNTIVWY